MSDAIEKPFVSSSDPVLPVKAEVHEHARIIASDVATVMAPAEVEQACEELNLVHLDKDTVNQLAKIGLAVESKGSVQVGNGAVMVCEAALLKCVVKIRDGITDEKSALRAQKPLCEISNSIVKIGNYLKTRVSTNAKAAPGPTRVESFAADAPVQLTQINFHGAPDQKS